MSPISEYFDILLTIPSIFLEFTWENPDSDLGPSYLWPH